MEETKNVVVSYNLKGLRQMRDTTQMELAQVLGVTRAALASYEEERSRPPYEVLIKLKKYTGKTIDDLIFVKLY